jgi:hypothetical protein
MADITERYVIVETTYKPERGLIFDPDLTLLQVNGLLLPWGFRLRYYGYEKLSMRYVYQFVTTKISYRPLDYDKIIIYHFADMTREEWLEELKSRLAAQSRDSYTNAWKRFNRVRKNRKKNFALKHKKGKLGMKNCAKAKALQDQREKESKNTG